MVEGRGGGCCYLYFRVGMAASSFFYKSFLMFDKKLLGLTMLQNIHLGYALQWGLAW